MLESEGYGAGQGRWSIINRMGLPIFAHIFVLTNKLLGFCQNNKVGRFNNYIVNSNILC